MIEHSPRSIAFRGLMAAVCLTLLAGCLPPRNNSPSATESQPPAVPVDVTATPGNAVVTLTWTASAGATGYNVKRATIDGGPYTQLAQLAAPTSNGFTDSSVTNGTAYFYVVSSLDAVGESANSTQVSATPEAPGVPPAAPTNLTATPGNATVILTWTASTGATGYNVKRATTDGGPYTQLAAATSNGFTDSSVTNGTTYFYVVSALNAEGESPNSAQASATPVAPTVPPAAPIHLTATPGNAVVTLTWTASLGATSYNVKRATTNGGPYTQLAAPTAPTYTDSSVTNGTTYYYVVSALNAAGEGANSAQASATPQAAPLPPAAPTNLTATPGNAAVTLAWTASTGATSYNVKRATTNGGPYTQLAQLAAAVSNGYTDSSVANGTEYFYVVSALSAAGESANSEQASATPQAPIVPQPPAAPTNLTAAPGNAAVTLSWTASTGATGYNVKRATTDGGPYTQLAAPTSTGYTDSSVTNGTEYFYVVSAINAAGESANSAQASATPQAPIVIPAAPTNLTATPGDTQVSLTWSASSGATSYNVKRATTDGGPYAQLAAPTSPAYTDSAVVNGTTYYYVVSAVNSAGESANSAQVVAAPGVSNPPPSAFGNWINVTPAGVDLTDNLCGNGGTQSVAADPSNPSNLYAQFNCQGIWTSTDFGATWTGPINTGAFAATVSDCVGGITVVPSGASGGGPGGGPGGRPGDGPGPPGPPTMGGPSPTLYQGCIGGGGEGLWKSVDGGVNWSRQFVAPGGVFRQDYYAPLVDPYDQNHLIMAGHDHDSIVESTDGGQGWTAVSLNNGMLTNGRTGFVFFINTGTAATTRGTWLWIGEQNGGVNGTWRTADGGTTWVQVDKNEHPVGAAQIFQPDTNGVVFMAGANSALGQGVLRSTDYGQTWTHVGFANNESVVVGTSENVYSMFGFAAGPGATFDSSFEVAAEPGNGTWVLPGPPAGLTQGAAQISGVNDGSNNILVGAMWNSGLWRYVEP
jgi:fibronectin type 3 domain-containing protein